ncbi:SURF1 family protein [Zhongshania sp.]|jgi:surfeit locus 1 family protein|uniref:SURF1 family protein n=1 Tax=Zhongshania sp. TaxID=1971902 RepID=UPI0039E3647D
MQKRSTLTKWTIAVAALFSFVSLILLGNWQLDRRIWKLDLIERVETRVLASPKSAPAAGLAVSKDADEYQRVSVTGEFLSGKDTLVVTATGLGSGYWVMTPFKRVDQSIVLINRGFINQGVQAAPALTGQQQVVGLLRMTEPKGSVVRLNDPALDRWYSRDVTAIAARHELTAAAYFIDAEKRDSAQKPLPLPLEKSQYPVGGLTVVTFYNSHLVYAVTWYGLALMIIIAAVIVVREERKSKSN